MQGCSDLWPPSPSAKCQKCLTEILQDFRSQLRWPLTSRGQGVLNKVVVSGFDLNLFNVYERVTYDLQKLISSSLNQWTFVHVCEVWRGSLKAFFVLLRSRPGQIMETPKTLCLRPWLSPVRRQNETSEVFLCSNDLTQLRYPLVCLTASYNNWMHVLVKKNSYVISYIYWSFFSRSDDLDHLWLSSLRYVSYFWPVA